MTVVQGSVERAMLVLKTWSVVGERVSRIESMKVMVVGRVKGAILCVDVGLGVGVGMMSLWISV